jgi:pimeloyl-ACP methyl ester carboxylesterase
MSDPGGTIGRVITPTLHHVRHGDGTPVLALHGWSPDHRLMTGCLEPVFARRSGYLRLYPDLPGMGRTPAPSTVAGSDDVLDLVLELVDQAVGEAPFLVVGESYGGYLARAVAHARPEQVLGLALVCPVAVLEPAGRTLPPRQVLRADPDLLTGVDAGLAEGFTGIAVVQSVATWRRYLAEIVPGLEAADQEAMARIRRRWQLSADPDDGPVFDRPALILAGRQDDMVGWADQVRLLSQYPRAAFAVLDVAGHNLQIEQPELFGALILEWLDRVEAERLR